MRDGVIMETPEKEATETIIKINPDHIKQTSPQTVKHYADIEFCRKLLYPTQIIHYDQDNHLHHGSISKRSHQLEFVMSAEETGHLPELILKHYTCIKSTHLDKGSFEAIGAMLPSQVVFMHYSIYESRPDIHAIIQGQNNQIWKFMKESNAPKISQDIPYGSIKMMEEIKTMIANKKINYFFMEGYQGQFFIFAGDSKKLLKQTKELINLCC